jgi:hypothetical protein
MMKRVIPTLFSVMVLGLVGCDKGTSTAPSTDPSRPNAERRLSVTSPGSQTVTQDRTNEMTISINRDRFEGPVEIKFDNLPKGVELVTQDMTIPSDKSSVKATVKAAADATPVNDHDVKVIAKAKEQKDLPEASVIFKMTVKAK